MNLTMRPCQRCFASARMDFTEGTFSSAKATMEASQGPSIPHNIGFRA